MSPQSKKTIGRDGLKRNLAAAKDASYRMAVLSSDQKDEFLEAFGHLIHENAGFLIKENKKDLKAQKGKISESLYQRLVLDAGKIEQIYRGVLDLVKLPDPTSQTLYQMTLDDGMVLEKRSVPIGVIGIVFESRPDVIPQILSLAIKSGNVAVLKGGKEAIHSNEAFMTLLEEVNAQFPNLPDAWAQLLDSREAFQEMLMYPQYVDLVIPRGSNELVKTVMESTQIPVLGHTEGICHVYVHTDADLDVAVKVAMDSKVQYPSACNALETLLVDEAVAKEFLLAFEKEANAAGIKLRGCARTCEIIPDAKPVTISDWQTEYGDLTLAIRVVEDLNKAIEHINNFGSHHTDAIITKDERVEKKFLRDVDSASVFSNASTRFADGFRFGMGAEVGISTNKTHARGPVGLEGLVIYKFVIRGQGHVVKDYVGVKAKPFKHQLIP